MQQMKQEEQKGNNQADKLAALQNEISSWEQSNQRLSTKMQSLQDTQQGLLRRKLKALEQCKEL